MVSTRGLLAAGVAGSVLFVLAFTFLGAIRPDYDPMRQFVSLLSLTAAGPPMTITFLVCGALIALGGVGLRAALPAGSGRVAIPLGTALAGIGFVLAGIFPTDPVQGYPPGTPLEMPSTASVSAALHVTGAFLFFGGMTVAAGFAARRFRALAEPGWAAYSAVSAILVFVANAVTSTPPGTISPLAPVAGLLQRVAIIAGLAWLALVCLRLSRHPVTRALDVDPGR
jgi:hypothetical protein